MKILCTGDLHIGRGSARVPNALASEEVSCRRAWEAIVGLAIRWSVKLVCLSGDIADQDNQFWEAIGPLEQGIGRLKESGIRTLAVCGNHDYDVLARLADNLEPGAFTLLGRKGKWQRITIVDNGQPALHVDGWSFGQRYVERSPLLDYTLEADTEIPTLAVVHGDLDYPASQFAPLRLVDLQDHPVAGWVLGHVHTPTLIESPGHPFVLYPGSPQAMDPGEPGVHGAWLVDIEPGRVQRIAHKALSSVRYETLDVDLTGIRQEAEFENSVLAAIKNSASQFVAESGENLMHLSLRLRLQGQTPLCQRLRRLAANMVERLELKISSATVGIDKIWFETTPEIDLVEQAQGKTPPAAVARLLLSLEEDKTAEQIMHLINQTRQKIEETCDHPDYLMLPGAEIFDEPLARTYLADQARRLLSELLGQVS